MSGESIGIYTLFAYLGAVMKLALTLLILCTWGSAFSQRIAATDGELYAFVRIYLLDKEQATDHDDVIVALLNKHGVTAQRYGEILIRTMHSERLTLSDHEEALVKSIAEQRHKDGKAHDRRTKKLCRDYPLSYERYVQLRLDYRSDPAFQHELKSYFDQAIKELHQ